MVVVLLVGVGGCSGCSCCSGSCDRWAMTTSPRARQRRRHHRHGSHCCNELVSPEGLNDRGDVLMSAVLSQLFVCVYVRVCT